MSDAEEGRKRHKWSVRLSVIVSGQAVEIRAPRLMPVRYTARNALDAAYVNANVDDWEMRDADGKLLEMGVKVKDYGLVDGQQVYLNARPGVGA